MSSKISGLAFPCYAPPVFPEDGRLILSEAQVNANYLKQINKNSTKPTVVNRLDLELALRVIKVCILVCFLMVQIIMNIMTLLDTQPILPNCFIRPIRTQKNRDILTTIYRV